MRSVLSAFIIAVLAFSTGLFTGCADNNANTSPADPSTTAASAPSSLNPSSPSSSSSPPSTMGGGDAGTSSK
jgi:ABC-type oligopeptide transport system substrate-binding subunit